VRIFKKTAEFRSVFGRPPVAIRLAYDVEGQFGRIESGEYLAQGRNS
jgi:hypothetical protein